MQRTRKLKALTALLICTVIFLGSRDYASAAWPWSFKGLAAIDGEIYSADDYRRWWNLWKDENSMVPEEPDDFIEWQLLVNEAKIMELDLEQAYKRKLDVFLRARTRMLLKDEAVNARIDIPEATIRAVYEKDYSPVYHLNVLIFKTEESAREMHEKIQGGVLSFEDAAAGLKKEDNIWFQKGEYRPVRMRRHGFFAVSEALKPGEISAPVKSQKVHIILNLIEKVVPDTAEYEKMQQMIHRDLWKEQELKFTGELISELKEKYEVRVDDEVFGAVSPGLSGDVLDKPLIFTNRENIPARKLVNDIRDEYRYRKLKDISEEEAESIKKGFLNGMIAGTLIEWESLDRHFEEREPFKSNFDFYRQSQLIKLLEMNNIAPLVEISADEVEKYYEENQDEFRKETLVSLASIVDEKQILDKMWEEIRQGKDFFEVAKKYYTKIIPVQEIPMMHLEPPVAEALENLAEGDVSAPFPLKGLHTIVKLVSLKQPPPEPLDTVRGTIEQKLRQQKFQELKKEYIAKLHEISDVEINRREWEKLREALQKQSKN